MTTKVAGILAEILRASIWATPSVADQGVIYLVRWSVMQTENGQRHFVGYNVEDAEGRVSTEIQTFDHRSAEGITRSGRIYKLLGEPGHDPDGWWVWTNWANARKIRWQDITEEYIRLLESKDQE